MSQFLIASTLILASLLVLGDGIKNVWHMMKE
jgi:hypothetical protein